MNPITKMMKNYVNMPLKKVLPLVCISAILLVSISITGCTQQQTISTVGNVSEGGSNQVVNGISATATQVVVPSSLNNTPKLGKGDNNVPIKGRLYVLNARPFWRLQIRSWA